MWEHQPILRRGMLGAKAKHNTWVGDMLITLVGVDTVCINQRDDLERSQQVALMGQIYSNATMVLAWLGEDPNDYAKDSFALMEKTHQLLNRENPHETMFDLNLLEETHEIWMNRELWKAAMEFCGCGYFERAWIQQEIGLSRDTTFSWGALDCPFYIIIAFAAFCYINLKHLWGYLGMPFNHGKTVPLEGFLAATSLLVSYVPEDQIASHNRNTDSPPPNSMSVHSPSARAKLQMITLHAVILWGEQYSPSNTEKILLDLSETFWVILRSRKVADTSDPRDKIFAYLSHPAPADLHGQPSIIPDYTKTMEDVFLETATLGLIKLKRAHVLTSIHHSESSLKTRVRPSWVPDYSIASYEVCLIREVRAGFRAGGETELEVNLSSCGRKITLAGLRVDTIQNSTDQIDVDKFSENPFDAETNALFHPLEKIMEFLEIRSPEQRKVYRNARIETVALWLSSAADSTEASDEDAQQLADFYSYRKELRLALKEGRHLDTPPINPPIPFNNTPVLQTYCDFCWDRKAYLTERGLVGLAPGAMQPGDIVCVIFGCDTPFVLRPEGDHYLIVGSCFLLGFMRASTTQMLMEEPIGREKEMFEIH